VFFSFACLCVICDGRLHQVAEIVSEMSYEMLLLVYYPSMLKALGHTS